MELKYINYILSKFEYFHFVTFTPLQGLKFFLFIYFRWNSVRYPDKSVSYLDLLFKEILEH